MNEATEARMVSTFMEMQEELSLIRSELFSIRKLLEASVEAEG